MRAVSALNEMKGTNNMPAYYEPMLFESTPQHPNSMGIMAILTEPVDGEILTEVVQDLRERFPYYYVRAAVFGNDLKVVENPLPMTVRNTWEPTYLHSTETNYHMAAFKYEGNAVAFEVSHLITDGSGVIPYFKSVLYLYLSRKTGIQFDSEGFRLPGSAIPESEMGEPFQINLDDLPEPFYKKNIPSDYFRIRELLRDKPQKGKNIYLKLPEEKVKEVCRENDADLNEFLSVLLARAVRRIDQESGKPVIVGVTVNHKEVLGNYDNYHGLSDVAYLDFPKERENEPLRKMCTVARGQLMLQVQPENSQNYLKELQDKVEQMSRIPLSVKSVMINVSLDYTTRGTACVSCADSRSFGPLDPYISEVFMLGEADAFDVQIEAAGINGSLCLLFAQSFDSEAYFDAFRQELEEAGITAEIVRKDQSPLSGVRFDDLSPEQKDPIQELFSRLFPL